MYCKQNQEIEKGAIFISSRYPRTLPLDIMSSIIVACGLPRFCFRHVHLLCFDGSVQCSGWRVCQQRDHEDEDERNDIEGPGRREYRSEGLPERDMESLGVMGWVLVAAENSSAAVTVAVPATARRDPQNI